MNITSSILIDIIILSYSKNSELKAVTEKCVRSLKDTETEEISFNVLVLETENRIQPFQFEGTKTIYPFESFNFNKYLNIGVLNTNNQYICFCNNDLIFHKNWASNIIKEMKMDQHLLSASPVCPTYHPTINIFPNSGNIYGYGIWKELAGWCFLVDRCIFDRIGLFDEHFAFWYADNDYANMLQKENIKHALVTTSIVEHLDGSSRNELNSNRRKALTTDQYIYFDYKWRHKNRWIYYYRTINCRFTNFFNRGKSQFKLTMKQL